MQVKYSNEGAEPLLLADVKTYLKVDYTDEDALITSLITAVRQKIEEYTGLALVVKTVEVFLPYLPEEVKLPFPEHDSITEIKLNGIASTGYTVKGLAQFIVKPNLVFDSSAIEENSFYAKYTTTGNCPEAIKQEMLRLIDEKYRNRGNTFEGSIAELSENTYANLAQFCLM